MTLPSIEELDFLEILSDEDIQYYRRVYRYVYYTCITTVITISIVLMVY